MEPTLKENNRIASERQDIDLGYLLHRSVQAIRKLFRLIGNGLLALFRVILLALLLVKKNILWFILGVVIGLGYAFYYRFVPDVKYSSTAVFKMNYGSTRALYNAADYLNVLRYQNKLPELARVLHITEKEAAGFSNIEILPVMSQTLVADMYKDAYLRFKRNELIRNDTTLLRTLNFESFKANLTKYDYSCQEVKIITTNADLFVKLQTGLIDLVSQNPMLLRYKELMVQSLRDENTIIERSLEQLDSLTIAYTTRAIHDGGYRPAPEYSFLDRNALVKAPEIELFNTRMVLKDELTALRIREAREYDIVQVYAPFNPVGQQLPSAMVKEHYIKYTLLGFAIVFILILLIRFYKFLTKDNIDLLLAKIKR